MNFVVPVQNFGPLWHPIAVLSSFFKKSWCQFLAFLSSFEFTRCSPIETFVPATFWATFAAPVLRTEMLPAQIFFGSDIDLYEVQLYDDGTLLTYLVRSLCRRQD